MRLKNIEFQLIFHFLIIIIFPLILNAQYHKPYKKQGGFRDGWLVNVNIGVTSFFGDLSVFDFDFVKKLTEESDFGAGIIFAKEISPLITFNTQFLYGKLKGTKEASNCYFNSSIMEGSFNGQINISQIISHKKTYRKINVFGNLGIGLVSIKSKLFDLKTDSLIHSFGFGRKTIESIIPFGFRINFYINERFDLDLSFSNKRVDTDKLDSQSGNNNKDFFSYTSVGVTYKFPNYNNRVLKKRKNRKPFKRKYPIKRKLKNKW